MKELLILVYELTKKLPSSENFGLKSQIQRAIVSVISNFVEGYLKSSKKEKLHFLEIAETSLLEVEAQGEICFVLNFWQEGDYNKFEEKRGEVAFLLYRYKSKISFSRNF